MASDWLTAMCEIVMRGQLREKYAASQFRNKLHSNNQTETSKID